MTALPGEPFPSTVGTPLFPDPSQAGRPLTLREADEDDLPELLRVDREAFPEDPYPYFVLRQLVDVHAGRLLVLADGPRLHGYVLYVTSHDRHGSWVMSLGVTRDQRGRGLGRRLMREVLRRLRAEGVREARLTVEPANAPAIMLYRSLGFDAGDGIRRDYFGPGEDRVVMLLRL